MRVLAALILGMVAGWFIANDLYYYLENIVQTNMPEDIAYDTYFPTLTGPFMLQLKLSFYIGLFVTLPYTAYQIWGFIAPGLRPNERKPIKVLAPVSVLLFFFGVYMCWLILPVTVQWFASFMYGYTDTRLMLEAGSMVFLLIKMMLSFGIGFQMPIIVFFLARLEIVTPAAMMKYWRHAVVSVVIASAVITPSGDPLSLAVLSVPLIALFFVSVYAARWTLRRQRSKEDAVLDDLD